MHFGEPIGDDRFVALVRLAYEKGIRTFFTADVYGALSTEPTPFPLFEVLGKLLTVRGYVLSEVTGDANV